MAQESAKKQQIEKSMNTMVLIASVAIFVTVFSLMSAHALINKLNFQNKVISAKTTARNQLRTDVSAAKTLTNSYENFNQTTTNLLGASVTGKSSDNAKIVLDALPSSYDYPALVTSLEAMLSNQGVNVDSIGGTDDSANLGANTPGQAVPMPFSFSVDGPYQNIQNVINEFEKSIRPFQIQTINLSGSQSDISLNVTAQTFYEPSTTFTITKEKVQ